MVLPLLLPLPVLPVLEPPLASLLPLFFLLFLLFLAGAELVSLLPWPLWAV